MQDFLESVSLAMGDDPHIISAKLDPGTWATAGKPHTWQRVEQSRDGSIAVWLDTAYSLLAVQYESDGHPCFACGYDLLPTPDFIVVNRTLHPELPCYIWRPEA